MITKLTGTDTANAKFHWEIDYTDVPNRTGISLYAGENNVDTDNNGSYDAKWESPDLDDGQWHTLHAAAWVEGANVRQKTWLDGVLVEDWVRRSYETVIDPIFGFNDHMHPHQWYTEAYFDYFRMSALGAFAPDGTLLTPFPEICSNGIDDDLDGQTDCADEADCGVSAYCCRQRHNPVFDADDDGDVDAADFALFQRCLTLEGLPGSWNALSAECKCLDMPGGVDHDIDMADDFDAFMLCARGPGVPAPAQCDQ